MAKQTYEKALLLQVWDTAEGESEAKCAIIDVTRGLYGQLADYGILANATMKQAESLYSLEFWNYAATYCVWIDDNDLMDSVTDGNVKLTNFSYDDNTRDDDGVTVRTECNTLIVVPSENGDIAVVEFYFTAGIKNSGINLETAHFKLADLMAALEQAA